MLEQVVGTLGLIETWVLIVYGHRQTAPFTKFEAVRMLELGSKWSDRTLKGNGVVVTVGRDVLIVY